MSGETESVRALRAMASLATPMAIRVAATLHAPEQLTAAPRTAAELAAVGNVDPDSLERVLRHLATVGVLTRDEQGRYATTELGSILRDDHSSRLQRHFDIEGAVGHADLSFVQLLHSAGTGAIIHNWDDDSARAILRRCAEAAGTTGKVFVIERTGSDGKSPDTERDLQQLVYFGGRDRAVSEITDLAGDVGLELVQAHPAGISKVIELTFPTPLVVRDRRQARHGLNEQRGMIPL